MLLRRLPLAALLTATVSLATAGELSPGLQAQLYAAPPDSQLTIMAWFDPEPVIEPWDPADHKEHSAVYIEQLQRQISDHHQRLDHFLKQKRMQAKVQLRQDFWLAQGIAVTAVADVISEFASCTDIELLDLLPGLEPVEPVRSDLSRTDRVGLAENLHQVLADSAWSRFNKFGQGRLIAVLDSGVDGLHPALAERWQGLYADPATAWLDFSGLSPDFPFDDNGHGTHVLGTACGADPVQGDTVGVAPGARWIAANAIRGPTGPAFDLQVLEALQWLADPDDDPATSADRPDVVINAWGVNESFSGYNDCDNRFWNAIDNCEALGIVMLFAAGNEGPGAGTIRSPADRATTTENAFSVGAVEELAAGEFTVAGFSSRGPSGCGNGMETKPEIVAPGVHILSSVPGGEYESNWSGTSMAVPHLGGAVALLREADPLLTPVEIKQLLMESARDIGAAGEDNQSGAGMLNLVAALSLVLADQGMLIGVITDLPGQPLADVEITAPALGKSWQSGADGLYSLDLPPDEIIYLSFHLYGYQDKDFQISIPPDPGSDTLNVVLEEAPVVTLTGQVTDPLGEGIASADIALNEPGADPVLTDSLGNYTRTVPGGATYEFRVSANGFSSLVERVNVPLAGGVRNFTLFLSPVNLPSDPDFWGYRAWDNADGVAFQWYSLDPDSGGPGTEITLSDDGTAQLSLPFDFRFYGEEYSTLQLSANGVISFGTPWADYSNHCLPAANGPAFIAPWWTDLNPEMGGTIRAGHLPDVGAFAIEFCDVLPYNGPDPVTFAVLLYDTLARPTNTGDGELEIMIAESGEDPGCTIGIQPGGYAGLNWYCPDETDPHSASLVPGTALRFTTGRAGEEDNDPPVIHHLALSDQTDTTGSWTVTASLYDLSGVSTAELIWQVNQGNEYQQSMINSSGIIWSGSLPAGPWIRGTRFDYRIRATDGSPSGNTTETEPFTFFVTQNRLYEPFATSLFPADWSRLNFSGGNNWGVSDDGSGGWLARVQYSSPGQLDHCRLQSPVLDLSGTSLVTLTLDHHLMGGFYNTSTRASILGSADGGLTWPYVIEQWNLDSDDGLQEISGQGRYSLPWAAGRDEVCIGFEYEAIYDWYWEVDNIRLDVVPVNPEPVTDLTIQRQSGQYLLSWSPSWQASEYQISRSTEPYSGFLPLTTTTDTSQVVVSTDSQVFFQVTAVWQDPENPRTVILRTPVVKQAVAPTHH